MAYRKSNDNWKQMLIRLDEMGERAFFMHLLIKSHSNHMIQWFRTGTNSSGYNPRKLFWCAMRRWHVSASSDARVIAIFKKM